MTRATLACLLALAAVPAGADRQRSGNLDAFVVLDESPDSRISRGHFTMSRRSEAQPR